MNIVIEGPDGSGKTSVAKAVARIKNIPYVRCPGTTPLGEKLRPILKDCAEMHPVTKTMMFAMVDHDAAASYIESVFDRCGISGLVYRKASGDEEMVLMLLDLIHRDIRFMHPYNSSFVILDAPDVVLDERMNIRPEDKDEGTRFAAAVRRVYRSLPWCIPRIMTNGRDAEDVAEEVVNIATKGNDMCLMTWAMNL